MTMVSKKKANSYIAHAADIIEQKNEALEKHIEESIKQSIFLTNLIGPVDEIDALASLLGMARKVEDRDRYGYDLNLLDGIVLRRIRALARRCQDDLSHWNAADHGPVKHHELDDDEAPHC